VPSTNPLRQLLLAGSLALAGMLAAPCAAAAPTGASATPPIGPAVDTLPHHALPSPTEAANTCAACHSTLSDSALRAPAKECAGSAHRDDRIGCVGCHKGDPRDPTVGAHAKANGFQPHPTHAEVAGICGGCHSDPAFMRRINGRLQIGQAGLFNLSLHGKLSAAGDTSAPNCAVCHGKHNIVSPSSAESPVNRLNVAKLCSGCHSDAARMGKYDARTDQYSKWQKSVHGQAFAKGNVNAPTCTGCHGAHASAPPDSASVAHACGRCHETEMTLFERSAHSPAFRKRGIAQCVACHGNHDIAPAGPLLVGTTPEAACMKCHEKDEKPRQVADAIAGSLGGARERAANARAAVARARENGLGVAGAKYSLDQMSTAEQKLRGVVHTLDPSRVEAGVADIDHAIDDTLRLVAQAERERHLEMRDFYVALGIAAFLLAALAAKARQLDKRRRSGGP
jgi:Cytochrome c3